MTSNQIEQKIYDLTLAFYATRKAANKILVGRTLLPTSTIMFYLRTSDRRFVTSLYGKSLSHKKLDKLLELCEKWIIRVYKAANHMSPQARITLQNIINDDKKALKNRYANQLVLKKTIVARKKK
jgi:hypothetical protein